MPFNRFRPLIIVIRLRGMMDRAEKNDDSSRGDKLFLQDASYAFLRKMKEGPMKIFSRQIAEPKTHNQRSDLSLEVPACACRKRLSTRK